MQPGGRAAAGRGGDVGSVMSKGNKGRACTMGKRWRAQSRLARRAFAFAGRVFVAQFRSRCNCTRVFLLARPSHLCLLRVFFEGAFRGPARVAQLRTWKESRRVRRGTSSVRVALTVFFFSFPFLVRRRFFATFPRESGSDFGGPTNTCAPVSLSLENFLASRESVSLW